MNSGEGWRLGHRPALDGLRGVAIVLVVAYHSVGYDPSAAGVVGVTAFFTLSGFLITALLLAEGDRGGVLLGGFYARRARRLLPALAVFLVVMTAVEVTTRAAWFFDLETLPGVAVYVGNWMPAAGHSLFAVSHVWSLAVEEQFYLVWPIALILAAKWRGDRGVAVVAAVGIVASVALRGAFVVSGHELRAYYGTDTAASALLLGALVAVLVRRGVRVPTPAALAALAGLVLVAAVSRDRFLFGPLAAAVLAAVVVAGIASTGRVGVLEPRWLVAIGRRSYGLYLWHFPLVWYVAPRLDVARPVAIAVMLGLAGLLTVISWRYVEEPFLRPGSGHAGYAPKELVRRDVLGRGAVGA
jgi:peptidoglycan/LPS O-acetylase OafA/YrhL